MSEEYLVYLIVNELKLILTEKDLGPENVNQETTLFGENSVLDSLDLVSLLVKVEEHILIKPQQKFK